MTNTCNLCSLSLQCLSPVIRTEVKQRDLLIVCDQPDSKADFEGEAFAGPLGGLLRSLLQKANVCTDSYNVVYAVKCALHGSSKTLPLSSIEACRSYLKEEIDRSRPRYILCLGDVALRSVTKRSGVRNNRGMDLSVLPELNTDAKVFCSYSLEYLAQNSQLERTVISDIRRCIKQEKDENVPWKIWEGEELDGGILAYDIEAVDEEGNFTDYPTQVAVCNEEICYVTRDINGLFSYGLQKKRYVGHNSLAYDSPMLRKQGIQIRDHHDTMYMAFFMDETQPRGLEALAVKYLGVPGWKESFNAKIGSEEFYFYNARDTWYTMQLFQLFKKELSRDKRFYLMENLIYPVRRVLDDMSSRGVCLDSTYILDAKKSVSLALEEKRFAVIAKMGKLIPSEENLNPNSTLQIAECLNRLGCVLPTTDKGHPQTSKDVLQDFQRVPFVRDLLEYREQAKILSTYVKPYEKLMNEGDGKAHPEYKMVSVETGRTSATRPNVQNLDRELKGFFCASKGKVLVSIDYNAIEFRIASWLAKEQSILSRFKKNPSWDPHRFFAAFFYEIREEDVTKEQRQIAKSANFSQLYCGNGFTLFEYAKKQGVELNLYLCEKVHEKWHATFPGFERYYNERKSELLQTGQIVCPTGFIRHFGDKDLIRKNYGHKFFGKLRQSVNVPVQNLSAHIAFLAMKQLREMEVPMVLFIHDSIGFELEDDDSLNVKIKEIEQVMCHYPVKALKEEYGVDLSVPLMVESTVKKSECK